MFSNITKGTIIKAVIISASLFIVKSGKIAAQEFVVIDDTIEYDMDSPHGYIFYKQSYISSLPQNWASPYNYKTGQFYIRYEVISAASDEPCELGFGIWQDRINPPADQKDYSETMANGVRLNGPGSIEYANSSPATWWKSYEGVDFSRVDDFIQLGLIIWSVSPKSVIAPKAWGGDSLYIDEVWEKREEKWFPIKIKVMIIAVANGHAFSGWENYVTDPVKPPTPDYDINYINETTTTSVPSIDEYSTNSNMSGATSGTGTVVTVTPGQDLYFRTKAEGINPASDIQHLDVPDRPASPNINIDYGNEQTVESIASTTEYSLSSNMSGAISGTGTKVPVTPGQNIYFRHKATASKFKSAVYTLNVPERPDAPNFTIDYMNEQTNETVPSTVSYSTNSDMSGSSSGSDDRIELTPGTDMYFQTAAAYLTFKSEIQHLEVSERPVVPTIGIDFENSLTNVVIPSSISYSENEDMSSSLAGEDDYMDIESGNVYYFQQFASGNTFASDIVELIVPEKPVLSSDSPVETSESPIVIHINFDHSATNFDISDIEVINGIASNLRESFIVDIHPTANDSIIIEIPHNIVDEGNFKSNRLAFYYQGVVSSTNDVFSPASDIIVYPNPAQGHFTVESDVNTINSVEMYSLTGQLQNVISFQNSGNSVSINTTSLKPGYYFLKINSEGTFYQYSVLLK